MYRKEVRRHNKYPKEIGRSPSLSERFRRFTQGETIEFTSPRDSARSFRDARSCPALLGMRGTGKLMLLGFLLRLSATASYQGSWHGVTEDL